MSAIDMHCDTVMLAYLQNNPDIYQTTGMLDFVRMKKGGVMAQFFAAFMLPADAEKWIPGFVMPRDRDYIEACATILNNSISAHSDLIAKATNASQIESNYALGKMSAVFSVEDGRAVEGKLENIDWMYDLGVRAISLTWNAENCFGAPNSQDPVIMQKGLTDFGKDAVLYLQEKGILVDVSHLSDGGFHDVAALCKKPFVATHSNCRALSPHQRNLTDDMIRTLAEHGGVMGMNFGPEFLNADLTSNKSTIESIVAMALHVKEVGGVETLAIGTDFDGIHGELEIASCADLPLLADQLRHSGFSDDEIDKVFYRNVLRVMHDTVQ